MPQPSGRRREQFIQETVAQMVDGTAVPSGGQGIQIALPQAVDLPDVSCRIQEDHAFRHGVQKLLDAPRLVLNLTQEALALDLCVLAIGDIVEGGLACRSFPKGR
jgi:hypothetical protein